MADLHLYGFFPLDRSGRPRWMLHELGLDFEDHRLSFRAGDQNTPAYRAISPLGRVPALTHGDHALCETSVILDYLGRTFGTGSLNPGAHDDDQYRVWLAIASSSLDHVCFEFVRPDVPEADRPARRAQAGRDLKRALLGPIAQMLADRDTMLPAGFSAVDIQVAASLHYADGEGQLADHPGLRAWLDDQRARPAARAAGLFG